MMISKRLFLVIISTAVIATAQQSGSVRPEVNNILGRMQTSPWADRTKALAEAERTLGSGKTTPGEKEEITLGLIDALEVENAATKMSAIDQENDEEKRWGATEDHEQYYASLIGSVSGLGDERAIPALLAAAPTGGMATQGVARFGTKALRPVLQQSESQDFQLASGAVHVIREMLKMHTVTDPAARVQIKNALRLALSHPEFEVRLSAIGAIEYLDDRDDFVSLLKQLARDDPFEMSQPNSKGGTFAVFVVREDATRLLRKIEAAGAPANQ